MGTARAARGRGHGTHKVQQTGSANSEHPVGSEGLDLAALLLEHVQLGHHSHRLDVKGERPSNVRKEEVVEVRVQNLGGEWRGMGQMGKERP